MEDKEKITLVETDTGNEIQEDISDSESAGKKETEAEQGVKDSIEESKIETLEDKLNNAEKKAEENYDRFLRLSAEFDNYKKRSAREMENFRKFANESLLKDMIPFVDNLERAIVSTVQNTEEKHPIVEGVSIILKDVIKVLEKHGVKPVDAVNQPFDPKYHEAMGQAESDELPESSVLNVIQKGYMIHDRLLRPAMVIVSKRKSPDEA